MQQTIHLAKKVIIALFGLGFLALGLLSIVVPVLPGFLFLIISAGCFASISETARLKFRTMYHRYRQRHIPEHKSGLSYAEQIKLRCLQWSAEILRWLK